MAAKTVALGGAAAIFAVVSWRLWPQRLFAAGDQLDGLRVRFTRAAAGIAALVALAFVLGAAAAALA